jgi:hypothetical protein
VLKGLAESIGMSGRIASHCIGQRKEIGAAAACPIKHYFGKPHGWMAFTHLRRAHVFRQRVLILLDAGTLETTYFAKVLAYLTELIKNFINTLIS